MVLARVRATCRGKNHAATVIQDLLLIYWQPDAAPLPHRRLQLAVVGCKELCILCLQALPHCGRRDQGAAGG